jgi:uncharacterized protein (DUF488 family)
MRVITLGYEKRTITEYIGVLKSFNVKIVIDVRETAWSYKKDFCKKRFSSALSQANIIYYHMKELGNPKSIRKKEGDVKDILADYKNYLLSTNSGINDLLDLLNNKDNLTKNICLTCFERNFTCCHRSIIIDHIKPYIKKIKVTHL